MKKQEQKQHKMQKQVSKQYYIMQYTASSAARTTV